MSPTPTKEDILKRVNRSHRRKHSEWSWGVTFLFVIVCIIGANILGVWWGRRYQIAHTPPQVTVRVANPRTGDWSALDLTHRPVVNLYCGNPHGGYACEVNRIEDGMPDGTGVLLMPSEPGVPEAAPQKQHEDNGVSKAQNL